MTLKIHSARNMLTTKSLLGCKLCTDICKTIFVIFEVQFHYEGGLVQRRYFELFFLAWSIFSSYKISAPNDQPFNVFYICSNLGQIFCTNVIKQILCQIWVLTNSKSAANVTWQVYWMRNRGLLLQTFCTLYTQLAILTYSGLYHICNTQ